MRVTLFSDPVCPWAYCAEPQRVKLRWTFGEQLDWQLRVVVLNERPEDIPPEITTDFMGRFLVQMADRYGMPIDRRSPERLFIALPADRAVVAARRIAPGSEWAMLRELARRCVAREPVDEDPVIARAAEAIGLDPERLQTEIADPACEAELREDMALARRPTAAAMALRHKLTDRGGPWRYTCPSYLFEADGRELIAPGYQPYESYDMAIANLAPELERRAPAGDVTEALRWGLEAGEGPLATAQVAAICGIERDEARERLLVSDAVQQPLGADAFWTLPEA